MAEAFVGIEIAVIVVTASILLAGILVGVGRALGLKRVEVFGFEELIQSVINAAIIGSFAAIVELVGAISASVVTESCGEGNVIAQLSCILTGVDSSLFLFMQGIMQSLSLVGFYQGLSLDFGSFAISPFANLASVSDALSSQLLSANMVLMLVGLNAQITAFIGQNALALLFPAGLVLRTFFATRRLGGFLIALSLGLYVLYPTFVLVFPDPVPDLDNATMRMGNLTANGFYAALPVIDLNSNYAIAGKLDVMSGRCDPADYNITSYTVLENGTNVTYATNVSNTTTLCDDYLLEQNWTSNVTQNMSTDMGGDLTLVVEGNTNALSRSLLYSAVAPIFSLIITVVFVRELANILGSEIGLKTFASI